MSGHAATRAKQEISLTVNGRHVSVCIYPMQRLLDVLRHELGLTGAKEGCGEGECGSCGVLLNGTVVNSCLIPILQAQNSEITTIEGLSTSGHLHALQQAFLECGAAQCGICTPGMILAAAHLLASNPNPTTEEIQEGLAGNLCRCTGYSQIVEAVAAAAAANTNAGASQ